MWLRIGEGFYRHGRDGWQSQCKKYQQENAKKRSLEILLYHKDKPCTDCGGSFPPECMDFDHVRGKKRFTIGSNGRYQSVKRLLKEIAKCEVVYANCHRTRTKNRALR